MHFAPNFFTIAFLCYPNRILTIIKRFNYFDLIFNIEDNDVFRYNDKEKIVMKPIRVLFTSILILTTLLGDKPKRTSLPKAKKQFELTYYDIREEIMDKLPNRMFIVDFDITEEGKVENARIVEDVNLDLSRTVINKVMALKFKPALQNGRPVRVRYKLPIVFK